MYANIYQRVEQLQNYQINAEMHLEKHTEFNKDPKKSYTHNIEPEVKSYKRNTVTIQYDTGKFNLSQTSVSLFVKQK